ncbi:hypothetical protein XENOCAPTIV_028225 [Xenoophorus captivus]|uniref:EF-hand domain-containing protein n=1 Tax=Xenoophorus captivus TaxID=1517983 RepID=A0ABV0QEY7_9TELE
MDKDGYISNGELFQVLKMMVGNNLKDTQLQQIVDKTIINADKDGDGRISFEEFCAVSRRSPGVFMGAVTFLLMLPVVEAVKGQRGKKSLERPLVCAEAQQLWVSVSVSEHCFCGRSCVIQQS